MMGYGAHGKLRDGITEKRKSRTARSTHGSLHTRASHPHVAAINTIYAPLLHARENDAGHLVDGDDVEADQLVNALLSARKWGNETRDKGRVTEGW